MNPRQQQNVQILAGLLVVTAVATNWLLGSIPDLDLGLRRLTSNPPPINSPTTVAIRQGAPEVQGTAVAAPQAEFHPVDIVIDQDRDVSAETEPIRFVPVEYEHHASMTNIPGAPDRYEFSRFTATVNAVAVFNMEPGTTLRIGPIPLVAYDLYVNGHFVHHYTKDDDPTSMRYEHPENVSQVGVRVSPGQNVDTADFVFYKEWSREPPPDWYKQAIKSFAPTEGESLRHIKQDVIPPGPTTIVDVPQDRQ
ncbi:MAG TPA: hypothetical protein VHE81_03840 [Lacipirellulaceae bacterium]|nr:hypothetical protein [Lacipirellulaceae bacterium]